MNDENRFIVEIIFSFGNQNLKRKKSLNYPLFFGKYSLDSIFEVFETLYKLNFA